MKFEEKIKGLKVTLAYSCEETIGCVPCCFFDFKGTGDDDHRCGIRDIGGRVPCHPLYDVKTALGILEGHKPTFPEEIEQSIMKHFTEVE